MGCLGSCSANSDRSLACMPLPDPRIFDLPRSESQDLNNVEDGSDGNDNDDTIPKVSRKCITRNLQIAVIEEFA